MAMIEFGGIKIVSDRYCPTYELPTRWQGRLKRWFWWTGYQPKLKRMAYHIKAGTISKEPIIVCSPDTFEAIRRGQWKPDGY